MITEVSKYQVNGILEVPSIYVNQTEYRQFGIKVDVTRIRNT